MNEIVVFVQLEVSGRIFSAFFSDWSQLLLDHTVNLIWLNIIIAQKQYQEPVEVATSNKPRVRFWLVMNEIVVFVQLEVSVNSSCIIKLISSH